MKATLRTLLSLAVAALLLAALVRWGGLSFEELLATLRRLSPGTYAAALALHVGVYLLRAARFRALVPPRFRPRFASVLAVSSAHNLAAYVLPAKTGEAAFVVYLKGVAGVPGSEGLASLLVSRLLDLATLAGSIGLAGLVISTSPRGEAQREWLLPTSALLLALAAALAVLCARSRWLVEFFVWSSRLLRIHRLRLGQRLVARAEGLGAALRHSSAEGRLVAGALLSLPLWLLVFLFYAVLARGLGLGEHGSFVQTAFGAGLATVANLLPINGFAGFGTQEAGWTIGFRLLGASRELALSTGIGVHLVQLFNVIVLGVVGHALMGVVGRGRAVEGPARGDDPAPRA